MVASQLSVPSYCCRRRHFRLMSQLLQCLQWLYMHQSSALPAASQYLVAQLPVLIATAGKGSVTLPMADFWAGLQTAIKPPLPAMLSFSRERLTLPPVAGGHSFDQVRGCPDNDAAVEWYWELGKRRLWWCL